jgi:hypothetical protein
VRSRPQAFRVPALAKAARFIFTAFDLLSCWHKLTPVSTFCAKKYAAAANFRTVHKNFAESGPKIGGGDRKNPRRRIVPGSKGGVRDERFISRFSIFSIRETPFFLVFPSPILYNTFNSYILEKRPAPPALDQVWLRLFAR